MSLAAAAAFATTQKTSSLDRSLTTKRRREILKSVRHNRRTINPSKSVQQSEEFHSMDKEKPTSVAEADTSLADYAIKVLDENNKAYQVR